MFIIAGFRSDPHRFHADPDPDPGFEKFADADPDPWCEKIADPDQGLNFYQKLVFNKLYFRPKSNLDQNADPDPDPGA